MATTYVEFDTTPQGLVAALKAQILTNANWTDQGVVAVSTTTTGSANNGSTTVTITSATGFAVGQWITISPGTATEQARQISVIAGTTITVSQSWGFTVASGATFRTRNTVLKSTSDRGASLIVDLEGAAFDLGSYFGVSFYRAYTGTAPLGQTDSKQMFAYFHGNSVAPMTSALHVVLSVGKNHMFISLEGPRSGEANTSSATQGSQRNYLFMCDLVPYFGTDTVPAVVAGGAPTTGNQYASTGSNNHLVYINRDSTNSVSWSTGKLASLAFPQVQGSDTLQYQRNCSIDGKTYLFPYVLFSDTEGIRGRLSSLYHAGTTSPTPSLDFPDPVGSFVSFGGVTYKLLAVNKGDGSVNQSTWGPLGGASNSQTAAGRTVVVAVPYSEP